MRKTSSMVSSIVFALALPILVLISTATANAADDKAREEAVLQFEHKWADTWLKADVNSMNEMLTDDFIEIAPDGTFSSRKKHLEGFSSRKMKFESMALSDMKVRFYGNVALVTGFVNTKSSYDGKDTSGKYAFTDVLVFHDGQWKAASTQATKVAL